MSQHLSRCCPAQRSDREFSQSKEEGPNQKTGCRTDDGDLELGSRSRRLPLERGKTPEHVQRDVRSTDAFGPRHERMSQLVRQHGGEKENRGYESEGPVFPGLETLHLVWKICRRDCPGVERKDRQPAIVSAHRDSEHAAKIQRLELERHANASIALFCVSDERRSLIGLWRTQSGGRTLEVCG